VVGDPVDDGVAEPAELLRVEIGGHEATLTGDSGAIHVRHRQRIGRSRRMVER
jgi:hypothetical protein